VTMSGATVEIEGVTKRYGQVVALSDVSLEMGPGVVGLLGPNGAGKTTLLKLIAGLLAPTLGQVRVLGGSPRRDPKLYGRIGYCPESERLYDFLTGFEFLELCARLRRLPHPEEAAERALERVDLTKQRDKRIGAYSRGMRQRIKVAQSLLHDPEVVLLDEPLKGADPAQRRTLIEIVRALGEEGKTVVVSSHILHEVERMASQIVLIHKGRLLARGDFHALRAAMEDRPHKVALTASDPKKLAALLTERAPVRGVDFDETDGQRLIVEVTEPERFYRELPRLAVEAGVRLREIRGLDEDLESVFRYLVER